MNLTKPQYYFVLGTNHSLCKADIINFLTRQKIDFNILEASEEILLLETASPIDAPSLINKLGSSVKIGSVFFSYPVGSFPFPLVKDIETSGFKQFFLADQNSEAHFAVSVYNGGNKFKVINKAWFLVPKIARIIKEKLAINYLLFKERKIPSFLLDKKNLLKQGFEMAIITGNKGVYVGKTLAIQDYQSYSFRDYGRPARDAHSGMIPPKLAKIMINLAGKKSDQVLLDPFCGSGTIIQEMILSGYQNVIGADLKKEAVDSARQNINWLIKQYSLNQKDINIKFLVSDARSIASKMAPGSVNAIVTEPYLGSAKVKNFSPAKLETEASNLSSLYLAAFREFGKILTADGVIVIIFPVFRFKNKFFHLEILDRLSQIGFKSQPFVDPGLGQIKLLKLKTTSRGSIIFFHPGQTVSREIFIFSR